jgi:ferredoxin
VRVSVDRQRCEGHGLCERQAPEVFALDDEGEVQSLFPGQQVPAGLTRAAQDGAAACPVAALTVVP